MLRLLWALIVMVAVPAMGQTIYKCPDASGRVTLSDIPCGDGKDTLKIRPNVVTSDKPGETWISGAKRKQADDDAQVVTDSILVKYRDAVSLVARLKQMLDNNESDKAAAIATIRAEQQNCRRGTDTRKCQDWNATMQADIDSQYHNLWMRTHRQYAAALIEKGEAMKEMLRLKVPIPRD